MSRILPLWNQIRQVWNAYWRDECLILSAAISFYTIFSVIPFIFLLFVIWGVFVGSSDMLYAQITQFAQALVPDISKEVLEDIRTVIAHRSALGGVGIFFLIWIFDVVFYSLAHAFDRIFGSGKRRKYYRMKIASFAALLLAGVIIYLSIKVAVLATAIRNAGVVIGEFDISLFLSKGLSFQYLIYFLLIMIFTAMFRIVPTVKVRFVFAFLGGILFVNLWYLAKFAFHWYVENIALFNIVYGTLGTLIVIVFWIFYSANILLICAECVSVSQSWWEEHRLDKEATAG